MSKFPIEYIKHILEEINYIKSSSRNLKYNDFLSNQTLIRAFSRSFEIIGEASKKIPDDFRVKYSDVDWKGMAGMRDKLIHDYFGVDFELIWDVAQNKIPKLKEQIERIIKEDEEK